MWKFQRPPYNLHVPNLNIKPILKFYWFSNTAEIFTISLSNDIVCICAYVILQVDGCIETNLDSF